MQNAFISKGGMFDLHSRNAALHERISDPKEKIAIIKKIIKSARANGIRIIYTATISVGDVRLGPDSPYRHKSISLDLKEKHPECRDKLLLPGTWGADIIEELKPSKEDIIIEKPRYSAFFQTNLDTVLRTYDFKYLIFTGAATNICVEATIRDAYYHEYFPIIISDATLNSGPPATQEATIFNIKACYGWVASSGNVEEAMGRRKSIKPNKG